MLLLSEYITGGICCNLRNQNEARDKIHKNNAVLAALNVVLSCYVAIPYA